MRPNNELGEDAFKFLRNSASRPVENADCAFEKFKIGLAPEAKITSIGLVKSL